MAKTNTKTNKSIHHPVLLESVVHLLAPQPGDRYLDLTAGYGGHASKIISMIGEKGSATLVDRDENAIKHLTNVFEHVDTPITTVHADFASTAVRLSESAEQYDMVLMDLGVSSPHLDNAARGFSFMADGPLDMRMDQSSGITAAEIINTSTESELVEIFRRYGEEPRSKAIARELVNVRPLTTTNDLVEVIERVKPRRGARKHPATQVFQALRIVVNDELLQLQKTLELLPKIVAGQGRVVIISFHSLEDRAVKRYFADHSKGVLADWRILTKKPVLGSIDVHNPRARSSVLRAAVKINML